MSVNEFDDVPNEENLDGVQDEHNAEDNPAADEGLFDFSEDLLKAFQEAQISSRSDKSKPVPDGKYEAETVKVVPGKFNGKQQLNLHIRIVNGNYKGRMVFRRYTLDPKGMGYLKTDLSVMGVPLEDLSQLKDHLENMLGKRIKINIQNKPYPGKDGSPKNAVNVYINELLAPEEPDDTAGDF